MSSKQSFSPILLTSQSDVLSLSVRLTIVHWTHPFHFLYKKIPRFLCREIAYLLFNFLSLHYIATRNPKLFQLFENFLKNLFFLFYNGFFSVAELLYKLFFYRASIVFIYDQNVRIFSFKIPSIACIPFFFFF